MSIPESEYRQAWKQESSGSNGSFGIQILLACSRPLTELDGNPDPRSQEFPHELRHAIYDAVDKIEAAIGAETIRRDPKSVAAAAQERNDLLGLFTAPVYVEDIPNGYCPKYCCRHLPWFVVTTARGRIKIGWRKSVIHISWEDSAIKASAEELFPSEDVTKSGKMVHAWGRDKAQQYVDVLLGGK